MALKFSRIQYPVKADTRDNLINALKTKKTGYELSVTGTPIKNSDGLQWDVLINWSTFKDVYLELPAGQQFTIPSLRLATALINYTEAILSGPKPERL